MYKFKITDVKLKCGPHFTPKKVNVVIGPNSCGKSRFLKDIRDIFQNAISDNCPKIIKGIKCEMPVSVDELTAGYIPENNVYTDQYLNRYTKSYSGLSSFSQQNGMDGQIKDLVEDQSSRIHLGGKNWRQEITLSDQSNFVSQFGKLFMVYVGTKEKLLLTERSKSYGFNEDRTNLLSSYAGGGAVLDRLYDNTRRFFKKDILLETGRLRYGQDITFIVNDDMSRHLKDTPEAERITYPLIDDEGDGLKNYVAVYLGLNLQNKNVILLDEPESFLHPPLIPQLAQTISSATSEDKQIFISTHSARLLEGLVNLVGPDQVNIIRLTRESEQGEAEIATGEKLLPFIKKHVFAAAGLSEGLFSKKVYVVESYSDLAFYSTLYAMSHPSSVDDVTFIAAEGKDTFAKIMDAYRSFNIPCFAIADFDFIASDPKHHSVSPLKTMLKSFSDISKEEADRYLRLEKKLLDTVMEKLKTSGFEAVPDNLKQDVNDLLAALYKYNVIVVKSGELETCLEEVGVHYSANKEGWLNRALAHLRSMSPEDISQLEIYKTIFG